MRVLVGPRRRVACDSPTVFGGSLAVYGRSTTLN